MENTLTLDHTKKAPNTFTKTKQWALKITLGALTGASVYLASPPKDYHIFTWIFLIPFFYACFLPDNPISHKKRFITGVISGFFIHLFMFYSLGSAFTSFLRIEWFYKPIVSSLSLFIFCTYSGIMFGIIALLLPLIKVNFPKYWGIICACFITLMEFSFPHVFPWNIGCGLISVLPFFQFASVFGIYGLTFLAVFINVILFNTIESIRTKSSIPKFTIIFSAVILIAVYTWGDYRLNEIQEKIESSKKIKIAMIQPNNVFFGRFNSLVSLSKKALEDGAQLLIWPETSMGVKTFTKKNISTTQNLAKKYQVPIIFHANHFNPNVYKNFSSTFLINSNGNFQERYDKIKLVPFTETFPLKSNWIKRKYPKLYRIQSGDKRSYWNLFGKTFTPLICYEGIFSSFIRKNVNQGANVIINQTNDMWFKTSDIAYHHLMITTVRAVEFGVPFLRSTVTGITTWTDPSGKTHHPSPLSKEHIWNHPVSLESFPTFYRKHGDILIYLCLFICVIAGLIGFTKRKKENQ